MSLKPQVMQYFPVLVPLIIWPNWVVDFLITSLEKQKNTGDEIYLVDDLEYGEPRFGEDIDSNLIEFEKTGKKRPIKLKQKYITIEQNK